MKGPTYLPPPHLGIFRSLKSCLRLLRPLRPAAAARSLLAEAAGALGSQLVGARPPTQRDEMSRARRMDRMATHPSWRDREALPADVWLIVYMHGGIDGKHARRLAHACRQMCAAASAHEDNITPAQPPQLLSDPLPALPADVWLKVYMHGGINGKHARRLAHACRQMCAAASAHEDNTILAQVQERSTVSLTGLFGDSDSDEE